MNMSKGNKSAMLLTNSIQNGYIFDHTQILPQYQQSNKQQSHTKQSSKQYKINGSKQNKKLMQECYRIIQQQQQYIGKLEKDNNRKNAIIENLLNRNQNIKSKNNINSAMENQIDQLKCKLQLATCNLQQAINRNQCYQIQVNNKNQQILTRNRQIKLLQKSKQELENEVKQNEIVVSQLKANYEGKIMQLVAKMGKRIKQDVYKSQIKMKSQENQLTNSEYQKDQFQYNQNPESSYSFQHNMPKTANSAGKIRKIYNFVENSNENYSKTITPIKNFNKNHQYVKQFNYTPIISQKMGLTKNQNYFSEEKKVRTEKKPNKQQIIAVTAVGTQTKQFPKIYQMSQKAMLTNCSTQKKQKKDIKNYNKMLIGVNDVQFVSDNYSDSYSEQSSIISNNYQNAPNTNNKLISIKQILNQATEFNQSINKSFEDNSQQNCAHSHETSMQNQVQNWGMKKQVHKSKISDILQDLNKKIEKFQRQQVDFQFI